MSDSSPGAVPAGAFSRRTLLATALVGTAALAAGCTAVEGEPADAVTPAQVDRLADQVAVQLALVAAVDQALVAAPGLGAPAAVLAEQARAQLARLQAAAPDATTPSGSSAGSAPAPVVPSDPLGARGFLRAEVGRAWTAHAAACPDLTGARAALLGSIAAGLRGAEGQLA